MPTHKPKPKPVGRPKLHKDHAKSNIVPVRFKGDDLMRVQAAAKNADLSVSEWIRSTLAAAIPPEKTSKRRTEFQKEVL